VIVAGQAVPEIAERGVWTRAPALLPVEASPGKWDLGVLLLITALMALYPFEYDTGRSNFSLGDAIVLMVTGVYALRALTRPVALPRYTVYVLLLALVALSSATVNTIQLEPYFSGTSDTLVETLKLVMAALWMCVVFWLLSRRFARRFLQLGGTSVLVATMTALGSISGGVEGSDLRATGPFENANLYGGYLCFNLFLALATHGVLKAYAAREHGPPPRLLRLLGPLLLFGCVPVLLLGMLSTGSRGALLGTAGGLVLSGLTRPRLPNVRHTLMLVGVLTVAVAATRWYVRQEPVALKRLVDTAEGDPEGVEQRLMLWQAARQAFAAHPLLGLGYGQFRNYSHIDTGKNKVAHQTYLSIAAELGILGLLAFGCLMLAVLRDTLEPGRNRYPIVTRAGRGYLLAALVQGMFANVQHSRAVWICIGVLAVQAASARWSGRSIGRGPGAPRPVWRKR
jgi:O-antigen ligase